MSRIRRISLAASAAAAVLTLAISTNASAISISGGKYDVSGYWTYFDMAPDSGATIGVGCYHFDGATNGNGWGLATGQASTPFVPPFLPNYSGAGANCYLQDDLDPDGNSGDVQTTMVGALGLTLTGLRTGQNPASPVRTYNGSLGLHLNSSLQFRPEKYPGCTVTVAGPQSVALNSSNSWITVSPNTISVDLLGVEFAATKTAGCPSRISNSVRVIQPGDLGWKLEGVTVTP